MFVHNRKLTDNYRNFTFIRTYFIVVLLTTIVTLRLNVLTLVVLRQQQHSNSKTTTTERVGVGEAPNSHYLLYFLQHHILFN